MGLGRADATATTSPPWKIWLFFQNLLGGNSTKVIKILPEAQRLFESHGGDFIEDARGQAPHRRCLHHLLKLELLSPVRPQVQCAKSSPGGVHEKGTALTN